MKMIRALFSEQRSIDRRIEKVIDYYADDESRLEAEVREYEATENVERYFRKFLETYQQGVSAGFVTEVGIWVSGFYGSGKSSFTKYLGFALDPERTVNKHPFLDLLADRFRDVTVRALLFTVAKRYPTAVVMLDLGAEQLADSATETVSNILYWKALQTVGFSKEKKLAQLEFTLSERGLYDDFRHAYEQKHGEPWEQIHNDPLLGVARAAQLLPQFLPQDFPDAATFRSMRFEMADNTRDLARRMIELLRQHTGKENILFLIDEAGQYVAPRGELILNLDGLARNLKELGDGKVWIVATGQQTLSEIVEKAAFNSTELNKLRDRFPISIDLDGRDIREITYRRLLTKKDEAEQLLYRLFQENGAAMITHTRLQDTTYYRDDPSQNDFVRFYPLLPHHFEVLMELIRILARSTGGVGLRSAIRVIQDVLVDKSRILPPNVQKLADRPIGYLATVVDFYNTLRNEINRVLPHVIAGVDTVERLYGEDSMKAQVARVVAALQPLEDFPRTANNIAALLYPYLGSPSLQEPVRDALNRLVEDKSVNLIDDPQSGGYLFLSESVGPLQKKRSEYVPASGELSRIRNQLLEAIFQPQPSIRLHNSRDVRAGVKAGRTSLMGEREEITIQLEMAPSSQWDERRRTLIVDTVQRSDLSSTIIWLFPQDDIVEEILPEIRKSEKVASEIDELTAERDVAQYARSERRNAQRNRERVQELLAEALMSGLFIFRGKPTPVRQQANTVEAAARSMLGAAAVEVFNQFHLVKIMPATRLAADFLAVERLDRMPRDRDPLQLIARSGSAPRIDSSHPALAETLRAFTEQTQAAGGRLTGKAMQDFFAEPPYGWSKDATRYLFAALLMAGEIELHTGGETLKTAGPAAVEAMQSTMSFNKVGVGLRDSRVSDQVIDQAARCIQDLFGENILPLEDHVSIAARRYFPSFIEEIRSLPDRLRLLNLRGEERARGLIEQLTDILKGDASNAASQLGAARSEITDDVNWGRAAHKALNNGGEREIQQARMLLADLADLEALYPSQQGEVIDVEEMKAIDAILSSDRFYEEVPNLRSRLRIVLDQVHEYYQQRRAKYVEQIEQAQDELEAHTVWPLLQEVDQNELLRRLAIDLPATVDTIRPLNTYRMLLIREYSLPGLIAELRREIERRKPAKIEVVEEEPLDKAVSRLEKTTTELEQTRKLEYLGYMASAMAHALNQPIGVIRAVTDGTLNDLTDGLLTFEEVKPRFDRILKQTDRLGHIVENMRAFARGDSRKREVIAIDSIVNQMCQMFIDQFNNRGIQLDIELMIDGSAAVLVNPVQIQEVLINLLTNARDAVEGQSNAKVWVKCWQVDSRYYLAVEDNGPGLAQEMNDKLFTPFATTKSSENGTGLGLFASRRMIQEVEGDLTYEDRAEGGARFVVFLPIHES